jgi:hypothetical protein
MEAGELDQSASEYGQVMGSCGNGKEFLGSIKYTEFID